MVQNGDKSVESRGKTDAVSIPKAYSPSFQKHGKVFDYGSACIISMALL